MINAKTTFGLPDEIFVLFGGKAQPSGQDCGLALLVLQGHLINTHRLGGKNQQDVVNKYVRKYIKKREDNSLFQSRRDTECTLK